MLYAVQNKLVEKSSIIVFTIDLADFLMVGI